MSWNQHVSLQTEDSGEIGEDEQKSYMIVVTDACLPLLASGESALSARVLINYELPTKMETYMRRLTSCLASDFRDFVMIFQSSAVSKNVAALSTTTTLFIVLVSAISYSL